MAIVLKEQKRKFNWFAVVVVVVLTVVIIGGGYLLFFTETPVIEIVAPSTLQRTAEIAEVNFDPSVVISHPVLKTLRQYGARPGVGQLGRQNPLIGF